MPPPPQGPLLHGITEGWTEPLLDQLLIADEAFDANGMALEAILRDKHGQRVACVSSWAVEGSGQTALVPEAATFQADRGPYTLKYQVTDAGGHDTFYPETAPGRIEVWGR